MTSDGYTAAEVIGGRCDCGNPLPCACWVAKANRAEGERFRAKGLPYYKDQPLSIADEARRLVRGERAEAYGPAAESFAAVGRMWGALLGTGDIEPRMVALMMAALKLHREAHKASRENRVDLIGYALLADELAKGELP